MSDRITVDGVTLTNDTDFNEFARSALKGKIDFQDLPEHGGPVEPLKHFFLKIDGTHFAELLSNAIAECMTDKDPIIRKRALMFFQKVPYESGAAHVFDLAEGDRSLFKGEKANYDDPEQDLECELMRTVGALLKYRDDRGIKLAREESLKDNAASLCVIEGLMTFDLDWVLANAVEICKGTPRGAKIIIDHLKFAGKDYKDVAERLKKIPGVKLD